MKCSVTYEIVTEESAEYGDAAERGEIGDFPSIREGLDAVNETRTNEVDGASYSTAESWHGVILTVDNGMEFITGEYETRSLHIPVRTESSRRRLIALLSR